MSRLYRLPRSIWALTYLAIAAAVVCRVVEITG